MLIRSLLQEIDPWIHWTNTKNTLQLKWCCGSWRYLPNTSSYHVEELPGPIALVGGGVGEAGQKVGVGKGRKPAEIIPHPAPLSRCGSSDPEFWRRWTTKEWGEEEEQQHSEGRWLDWIHQLNGVKLISVRVCLAPHPFISNVLRACLLSETFIMDEEYNWLLF